MLYFQNRSPKDFMAGSPRFPTTSWTLVLSARSDTGNTTGALGSLCERYWFPLYAYLRRSGYSVEQAQDLTQEFLVRVLEKRYFDRAEQSKGRFRSFVLACLRCFLQDERDRERTIKRGGRYTMLPFDIQDGEQIYVREPSNDETPEKIFERRWAIALLEHVVQKLRQEFAGKGKAEQFDALKPFLLEAGSGVPYPQLAKSLNMSDGALKVAMHRLKKQYRQALKAEIADTVSGPEEVEAEIRYLLAALTPPARGIAQGVNAHR